MENKEIKNPIQSLSLNEKNKKILNSIFKKKKNVFITGPGGCGKSYLLKAIKQLSSHYQRVCYLTATSGVASYLIGGQTIHKFSGITINNDPNLSSQIANKIRNYKKDTLERWELCDLLIIDEISMMGMNTFELINNVAQILRKNDKLFGGIQLVISGDFFQLPPINDDFVFKGKLWNELEFETVCLTTPYRYLTNAGTIKDRSNSNEKNMLFFKMLLRIRDGSHTNDDIKILKSRIKTKSQLETIVNTSLIKPTILYSKKVNVNKMNQEELDKLITQEFEYKAQDFIKSKKESEVKKSTYIDIFNSLAPRILNFKVGAQVMLTVNLNVEDGLTNGSKGVVIDCQQTSVKVQFVNDNKVTISKQLFEYQDEDVIINRTQIPLILAWSLTIHKIQGCTLDTCVMDLGSSIFENSMSYVALSRVKSLDGLYLSDFDPKKIKANNDVKKYYKRFLIINVYLQNYLNKNIDTKDIRKIIMEYLISK